MLAPDLVRCSGIVQIASFRFELRPSGRLDSIAPVFLVATPRSASSVAVRAADGRTVSSRHVITCELFPWLCRQGRVIPSVNPATEISRRSKDRHRACRDLDRFTGPGIPGPAGLAMSDLEGSEPLSSTPSPRATASLTAARKPSTISLQSRLVTPGPIASATFSTRSALVIPSSSAERRPKLVSLARTLAACAHVGSNRPASRRNVLRPVLHDLAATLQQVRTGVRRLDLVLHDMSERRLRDLPPNTRLRAPVSER